jgi:hypothetical protein
VLDEDAKSIMGLSLVSFTVLALVINIGPVVLAQINQVKLRIKRRCCATKVKGKKYALEELSEVSDLEDYVSK